MALSGGNWHTLVLAVAVARTINRGFDVVHGIEFEGKRSSLCQPIKLSKS